VYVGAHYPGDVLSGAFLGTGVAWAYVWYASRAWPVLRDMATRQPRPARPGNSPDRACRQ